MAGGVHGRGACVAGETAIAVGSMRPTGMHFCFGNEFPQYHGDTVTSRKSRQILLYEKRSGMQSK